VNLSIGALCQENILPQYIEILNGGIKIKASLIIFQTETVMFGKHHAIRIVKNLTGNRIIQQEPKVVISINPGKVWQGHVLSSGLRKKNHSPGSLFTLPVFS
jgi:hypothetical protein